jgi:hypothetical protein
MKKDLSDLRVLTCYKNNIFKFPYEKGYVTYLLFEMPINGSNFSTECKKGNLIDRACKYKIKEFVKSMVGAIKHSDKTDDKDVIVKPIQNSLWLGQLPHATFDETTKNIMIDPSQKQTEEDNGRYFITVPFPKYYSPNDIGKIDKFEGEIKKIKEKQFMIYFGEFLINMFKGFDKSTIMIPPNENETSDVKGLSFDNLTDLFLKMNEKIEEITEDKYFGVPEQYATKVKEFENKTLTLHSDIEKMNKLLTDSFYGFLSKLVQYDLESKKQFENFDEVLKHKFITTTFSLTQTKSDTS